MTSPGCTLPPPPGCQLGSPEDDEFDRCFSRPRWHHSSDFSLKVSWMYPQYDSVAPGYNKVFPPVSPLPSLCSYFPLEPQSSPRSEQSHEPLMRGFRFASTQPRLELMNKSNEWRVIIGQRERDGQRVGASGRKTWNYLSGKSAKWAGAVAFCLFPSRRPLWPSGACTCARATMEGKWPHTHTEPAVWISTALPQQLCHSSSTWDGSALVLPHSYTPSSLFVFLSSWWTWALLDLVKQWHAASHNSNLMDVIWIWNRSPFFESQNWTSSSNTLF